MNHLAPMEQKRFMNARCNAPAATECLPWLPSPLAADMTATIIRASDILSALLASVCASPVARHTNVLSELFQRAETGVLAALTRLAVAMSMDAAWAVECGVSCARIRERRQDRHN
jgi:HAMP domain-containing protein